MKKIILILTLIFTPVFAASAYTVKYNTNTKIYHDISCKWAHKCTKNCITIDHTDANKRGGRPCKVCGG